MNIRAHLLQQRLHTVLAGLAQLWPRVGFEVDVSLEHHLEDLLLHVWKQTHVEAVKQVWKR